MELPEPRMVIENCAIATMDGGNTTTPAPSIAAGTS
jgi:hypothetical protein